METFLQNLLYGLMGGSLVAYLLLKWSTRKKCEGSHLTTGCGKTIYIINKHTYLEGAQGLLLSFFKIKKELKSDKDFYRRFTIFRHAQYESVYCCNECFKKHEAVRIANILSEEEYKNDPYDYRYISSKDGWDIGGE